MATTPARPNTPLRVVGGDDEGRTGAEPRQCVRHPNRETLVSCGRCGRPFCPECLIHTPAGQRCYECAGVRRRAAPAAAAGALAKGFGVIVIGSAIASMLGLMGLLVAGVAGNIAGQIVGPSVNRHTRRYLYPLILALLVIGAGIGWSAPVLLRVLSSGRASVGLGEILFLLTATPLALVRSAGFWLGIAIMAAVGYQRVR